MSESPAADTTLHKYIDELNAKAWEQKSEPYDEAQQLAGEALALAEKANYTKGIAEALCTLSWRNFLKGNFAQMLEQGEHALILAEQIKEKSIQARAINNIGAVYLSTGKYSNALEYFMRSLAIREEADDKSGIAISLCNIGIVHKGTGEYGKALEYYMRSLAIYEEIGDKSGIAISLGNIGNVYFSTSEYSKSLEYYMRSLAIYEEIGDKSKIATSLGNIGNVYRRTSEYGKALEYDMRSLAIREEVGDKSGIAISLSNIGIVHKGTDEYGKALEYHMQSLAIREEIGDKSGIATSLGNIGNVYFSTREYRRAMEYNMRSLAIFEEIGDKDGIANSLYHLGDIYAQKEFPDYNVAKAIEYITRALELGVEIRAKKIIYEAHKSLADAYFQKDDGMKAYEHHLKYHEIEREVHNDESSRRIQNLEQQKHMADMEKEREFERRKQAELAEINNDLRNAYEEVRVLNEYLTEVNQQLEALNEEKNEFIGIAAHDMKNPLSIIFMTTELIINYHDDLQKDALLKKVASIGSTAKRMSDIITKLLDINAIESGKMNISLQEYSSKEIIEKVLPEYEQKAQVKDIMLYAEIEAAQVWADNHALTQVLENLLSNAIKYSPKGKSVTVRAFKAERNSEKAQNYRIEICDEGPGLTEEDKRNIFKKFAKLSAKPTDGEHSTGLGLSIVKKLVEAMNGKISYESETGNGAKFIVDLPLG